MKVFIGFLLFAVAFARQAQKCGENQHFNSCGTACPLTCDNHDNPPFVCVLMCVPGCHCDEGYVKTEDGACVKTDDCPVKANSAAEACLAKPDPGMCRAYFPMWYYNPETGSCQRFIYGGCQGNDNRYVTEKECMELCGDMKVKQLSTEICELPAESGRCMGYFPRFYFDKFSGKCKKFVYGGCGGNGNNFKSIEECGQTCLKAAETRTVDCSARPDSGLCDAYMPRFYYDEVEQRCKKFIYGGCGGNTNNFRTKEECNKQCGGDDL